MRPFAPLAALLLLAACGSGRGAMPAMSDGPAQAECRAEARQSPEVEAQWRRVVIGLPSSEEQVRRERAQAESRAFTDCLRRRGLVRGGGVEPRRQPGF
ncbi:phosphoribosylamine--glycine ligase [Falsiroseomonas sp. E2-1-a20]|uniref:phosphoribosylamine--glycine ligase n=1 Tax=Falsiroseomonas sp. E2-1-a20 TaxID=3239300 RepID=UPI003F2C30E6